MIIKSGGKYAPLREYLLDRKREQADEITLTFTQIETLLGKPLPEGARIDRGWWGNREIGTTHALAWLAAGYKVKSASLEQKRVTFETKDRKQRYVIQRDGDTVLWNAALIKALRAHLDMTQAQFAEHLGVRQQTVSEWETGVYEPTRATCKHLMFVAEKAGFTYGAE